MCTGCGQDRLIVCRGLCASCYARSPKAQKRKPRECGYQTMHSRLTALFGSASSYRCAFASNRGRCRRPARDWCYTHTGGPNERTALIKIRGKERLMRYSLEPRDYRAMCRSHHQLYDRRQERLAAAVSGFRADLAGGGVSFDRMLAEFVRHAGGQP